MFRSSTKNFFISLIILNVIIIVFYYYIASSIKSSHEVLTELAHERDGRAEELASISKIRNIAAEIEPALTRLRATVISNKGEIEFIERLEALGKTLGLSFEIKSVDLRALSGEETEYEFLDTEIMARGEFREILRLLELVENMAFAQSVDRAVIERSGSDWRTVFKVSTLKQKN